MEQGNIASNGNNNGNTGNPGARQSIPVKKLSQHDVQRVVEALNRMKQQGVDKKDPNYINLMKLLKAQSMEGHIFNPVAKPQTPTPTPTISTNGSSGERGPLKVGAGGMTPSQLFQLKAQILAYKYLSRNLALPAKLLGAIRTFSMKALQQQQHVSQQQLSQQSTQQLQQQAMKQLQHQQILAQQQQQLLQTHKQPIPTTNTPIQVKSGLTPNKPLGPQPTTPLTKQQVSGVPMGFIGGKPNIPTPTIQTTIPVPDVTVKADNLSVQFLFQERERRIKSRMHQRANELHSLPIDLDPELKRRALIELKQIKLVDVQKKLRAEIANRMRRSIEMEAAHYANAFSRARKPTGRTSKNLVEHVPTFRGGMEADAKLQAKQESFISAILKHQKDFKDWHSNQQKRHKKLLKEVLSHYNNEQKRQQLEEERKQRIRLQALRDEDEEGYRKLLQETKNSRLQTLLKQTDEYLDKIGALVQSQRGRDDIEEMKKAKEKALERRGTGRGKKKKEQSGDAEEKEGDKEEDKEEEEKKEEESVAEKNKKYYTMAHSVVEKVTEQPSIIVGGKLKNYQLVGLQWLVSLYNNRLNGILADEMGLGKTIQTISLIAYLMEKKGNNGPYLIVVPLSTLSNWTLEFSKWAPSITTVVYKGKPQTRKQIFKEEIQKSMFNVVVTSYEYIMIDKSDLGKIEWSYIIIDEGHRIKNKNSKLSNTLRQYMSRHRLLLTGTPLQNDLTELWSLLNFLLPHIFNSADNFEQWFNAPFAYANKGKAKAENYIQPNEEETLLIINRLHKVLRPFLLRRLKQDVESELPDKVEIVLKCDLSALQRRMYKNMVERGVMLLDPNVKGKTQKGFNNTLMQLQKICNHPYLFKEEYQIQDDMIRASGKFDLIDRILPKLHAAGHRILIFNQMTQVMDILEDYFQYRGYIYLRLDGSTKSEERTDLVAKWNDPNSPYWLFILSTKAGGLGLNLQTADTVIIFDTDWNPQADLQAQDRAHRIGQQKEVRIFRLISQNSVEEKILEKASFKLDVDAKVIQAGMFNTHANDKMRKAMLESLLRDESDDREIELVTSDEQVNSLIARNEGEYELYQRLDKERNEQEEKTWRSIYGDAPKPPRLMVESELPDYLLATPVQEDITETYGRGMRDRKEVKYNDGLSERQFIEMVENGENPDAAPRKRKITEDMDDEHDELEEEDDEDDDIARKKRKKSDDEAPQRKGRRGPKPKKTSKYLKQFEQIWNTLSKATVDGRQLSAIFLNLPSKRDFPDYYQIIKNPISMKQIKANMKKYKKPEEFKNDFLLMYRNARTYNEEGSIICNDALTLEKMFEKEYSQLFNDELDEDAFDSKAESEDNIEVAD